MARPPRICRKNRPHTFLEQNSPLGDNLHNLADKVRDDLEKSHADTQDPRDWFLTLGKARQTEAPGFNP